MRSSNFFDADAVTRHDGPNDTGGGMVEGKVDCGESDDGFDVGHGSGMGKRMVQEQRVPILRPPARSNQSPGPCSVSTYGRKSPLAPKRSIDCFGEQHEPGG
jgi:hypothetical protein